MPRQRPPASKRIAPYRVLPASDLEVRVSQTMGLSKDGPTVNYMPLTGEAWIEFDFEVAEAGRHQVNAMLWHSVFASVYQPFLDGEPFGEASW